MIPFLMASLIALTPGQEILDQARELGRDMYMGQICEVLGVATFDGDALIASADDLATRAQVANLPADAVDKAAGEAYGVLVAEFEARYPNGTEDQARAELTEACEPLLSLRPAYFKPFQAD